ncbi:AP-4 complex subunit sigma-like [Acanthaster planci]|uniref:AP complex subunit sigma n=1 Tax=Acanthaster planci TaxID=133434 RepID=A0A8B8A128_ACAPL|nr:AP-4 complex subunit sigma-like [Acanthaster planci]XP_022111057.1 AP-4 complex subunit sigma-like [Acanthaster planci]XP_022111058.1 AP-4 complex subunit sigma-like [Acanthaster planci]XP_022111059.1 AP-4 complex subunit sigma-like [Acanthaster planci]XP_022111060.1 AP-4 complex subunit sigma-like [Acanthaster planci]XP_022111061.1 AP-4 complex subunit sigma-like [Acanthaster planci]XP_022111063.1 AP-4 complex subunit sigma-like [Acanthaster planci]XP_022111064.1 AP-4 complex subunit sig
MLKFILIISKQGQTRLAQYYDERREPTQKTSLEAELIRKVLLRGNKGCSFLDYQDFKVVYRRYLSLYFLIGIDKEENEVAILEFIHLIVETLDKYFPKVTDLDIMFNLDKVYMILDEMVVNGCIVETSKAKILEPVRLIEQHR